MRGFRAPCGSGWPSGSLRSRCVRRPALVPEELGRPLRAPRAVVDHVELLQDIAESGWVGRVATANRPVGGWNRGAGDPGRDDGDRDDDNDVEYLTVCAMSDLLSARASGVVPGRDSAAVIGSKPSPRRTVSDPPALRVALTEVSYAFPPLAQITCSVRFAPRARPTLPYASGSVTLTSTQSRSRLRTRFR